jgi:hypothetical protein
MSPRFFIEVPSQTEMMRISVLLCLLMAILFTTRAFAQKQVALKFNITSPIAKTFNVAGEWAFTDRWSGQVVYFRTSDFTVRGHVFSGSGFTPEARFHLKPQRLKGFFVGPYVRFRKLTWEIPSKSASADFTSWSGGFVAGYQAVIKDLLIIDLFIGPSFGNHSIKVTSGVIEDFKLTTLTSAGVRSGIAIGIALF